MQLSEVLDALAALPEKDRQEVAREALEATKDLRWIPNVGPQTEAYFSDADIVLYGGAGGGGKGFRPDQPVLTPFGWRPIGALEEGSAICATDGTVQKVIAKHVRGVQPLYRLKWSDGNETVCDEDHIWLMWEANGSRKIANKHVCGEAGAERMTTRQVFAHYQKDSWKRLGIPVMSAPALFNVHGENRGRNKHISRSIPPYVLGALIGDGSLTPGSVTLTCADPELVERFQAGLDAMMGEPVKLGTYWKDGGDCGSFRLPNAVLNEHLEDLGLMGCKSQEKFIPRIYLLASPEERWELMRGLMDTDGWCEEDGHCFYATVSKQLVQDVMHLARSLGAVAGFTTKTPTYTHNGEKKQGLLAYNIKIKIREPARLFTLPRKVERCAEKEYQSVGIWLESIERAGEGETICISVSHPNSLFVTDGFIVTHNSDLELGLAFTAHQRTLIMRRQYTDLSALTDRAIEINGTRKGFNGSSPPKMITVDGRLIEFGAASKAGDEQSFQGRPHDLLCLDEAAQFAESQVRYLMGWVRSPDPNQRTRVLLASNPPLSEEGVWMVEMFAPWLDPTHPNPARPGELRWYISGPDNKDIEVDGPGPHVVDWQTEPMMALSRTFIPAKLADNPYQNTAQYRAQQDNLPAHLRLAVRDGDFQNSRRDHALQLIPTEWILKAQARWTPVPPNGVPMCAIGTDVALGGQDDTTLAPRHDGWYAPLVSVPGAETPFGSDVAALVIKHRFDNAEVVIDLGGGYGNGAYEHLKKNSIPVIGYKGAEKSLARTKDGRMGFANKRAEAYYRFYEALDPSQPGGSPIALPPDPRLVSDLAAIRLHSNIDALTTITLEPKTKLVERIGRSPDRADAVVMGWTSGPKVGSHYHAWQERSAPPRVNMGRMSARRK
jgi:hypothetical protein